MNSRLHHAPNYLIRILYVYFKRDKKSGSGGNRTHDLELKRLLLCRLSYRPSFSLNNTLFGILNLNYSSSELLKFNTSVTFPFAISTKSDISCLKLFTRFNASSLISSSFTVLSTICTRSLNYLK